MTGFAFALGAVVGSFLNVVIHRVPAGMSVVQPPSHCPACETQIAWYDNIPIISWALLLRGQCRHCDAPIPARYTVVEALTGVLTAAIWFKLARSHFMSMDAFVQLDWMTIVLPFATYAVFLWLLVAITFVDLEHLIIPHKFTVPGMVAGLAVPWVFDAAFEPGAIPDLWPPVTWLESSIGFAAGGISVLAIFYAYYAVRGVAGIGGGDVTLMAMVGAWLGWPAIIFIFFAASLQGTLAAAAAMVFGGALLRDSKDIYEEDEVGDSESDQPAEPPLPRSEAVGEACPDDEADTTASVAAASGDTDGDEDEAGQMAVPFGPFIALAAVEYLLIGDLLPSAVSMSYLYQFGSW
jgi:leader peptidase (prepilin peptidase)/N-methyltransferase